jgi:tetrahydromethanopterin S-methyltransferase subunit G
VVVLGLEERVARIEGVLEQIDKRLNHIESDVAGRRAEIRELRGEMYKRFDDLREDVNSGFREMDERLNILDRRFGSFLKWIIGLILGMWTSIMMTLIPILLKILGVI